MRTLSFPVVLMIALIILPFNLSALRSVARLDNPPPGMAEDCDALGYDVASYHPGVYLDLVVDEAELAALKLQNGSWYVTQTEAQLRETLTARRDIPGYRDYDQMVSELMQLQAIYPNLVQVSTIGSGWGSIYSQTVPYYTGFDHDLWAVKVSANVSQEEDEPAFYFVGEHHAREPISTEVCMEILIHLVENYGSNPEVTSFLDNSQVWIVPLLNPDGHKIVIDQTDVWWRKNIRDNNNNQEFNTDDSSGMGPDGVDINRNYGYRWGYLSATDNMQMPTYHGPYAFSEPEASAFADFISSRRFLAGVSYHTYGQYVLYPYGFVGDINAPDKVELQALATDMANVILKQGSTTQHYDAMPSWQLYPVSGSSDDWIYGTTGSFAYTIEMATQFIPNQNQMQQIITQNLNGAMMLLRRSQKKMLTGHVTNAETGAPIPARVWIDGYDNHPLGFAPICADSTFGRYYRLLPPGQYEVRYFLPGFYPQTRTVVVTADAVSVEDVQLTPSQPMELFIQVRGDFFGGVSEAQLVFDQDPEHVYTTDSAGWIIIPEFYPGEYNVTVSKPGYSTLRVTRMIETTSIGFKLSSMAGFDDGFGNGMGNWNTNGSWGVSSAQVYSGASALADSPAGNYGSDISKWCRLSQPVNLTAVENADLQFHISHNLSNDGDYCLLQYSLDGQNWLVFDSFTGVAAWTLKSYSLNSFIGQSVHLRFLLVTNSSANADGVFIDNFRVYTGSLLTASDDLLASAVKLQSWPNPFQDKLSLMVSGLRGGEADLSLSVYNLRGQKVWQRAGLSAKDGYLDLEWNGLDSQGRDVASGIYAVKLTAGGKTLASRKIMRVK
ncbi:MAG TPA: M14 family zinc carboxypeptidase [Candidatus Cloacimonadota bacterium]|nr:M14 family zinc carboxypeptidase [Candidatus Cloacimonadota bacterium]